jgi:hypothetical protein
MNMWGFRPNVFEHFRREFTVFLQQHLNEEKSEFFIPTPINKLVSSGQEKLKVLRTPDSWFGVTYREDRPRVIESVRQLINQGQYPSKLWS